MLEGLQLGVGVRADFAVQVDLFVLRSNPFHERCSLRGFNDKRKHSTGSSKEKEGKSQPAKAWLGRTRYPPNECLLIEKWSPRNRFCGTTRTPPVAVIFPCSPGQFGTQLILNEHAFSP